MPYVIRQLSSVIRQLSYSLTFVADELLHPGEKRVF